MELKNITTELKEIVDGFNWIFGTAQERISELESRSEESIQPEAWRGKIMGSKEDSRETKK